MQFGKTEIIIVKYNQGELENECVKRVLEYTNPKTYNLTVYSNYPHNENLPVIFNRCIERSDCEFICLLNSDAYVEKGWLLRLLEHLKYGVGAVAPVTDNATEQMQSRGTGIVEAEVMLSGFCLLFRKAVWKEVGGFDEHIKLYCDDDLFSWELKRRGYKLIIVKSVFVEHKMRVTVDSIWDRKTSDEMMAHSKKYYEFKTNRKWQVKYNDDLE